jgi:hypothetical protein
MLFLFEFRYFPGLLCFYFVQLPAKGHSESQIVKNPVGGYKYIKIIV